MLLAILTACRGDKVLLVKVCPQLACGVTLTVQLKGTVPNEYRLDAVTPDGIELSAHWKNGYGVYPEGYFSQKRRAEVFGSHVNYYDFTPEEVKLNLSWEGGQVGGTVQPVYRIVFPNGEGCPPECRFGEVVLDLEQSNK